MYRLRAAISSIVLLLASVGSVGAQSKLTGVDAFVASSNALAKAASERIDLGRSTARLSSIKSAYTDALQKAELGKPFQISLNTNGLLCDSRTTGRRLRRQSTI